ncbi:MAG: nuclear transport factor 2 family protein [Sphaerobacter sp.]|nr:nuclear transport factor 2 family protein [Sphaerobacter sp.]
MAAIDLAREYISHVNGHAGQAAAALFARDGEIAVPAGRVYRGWDAIAAFVAAAPPGTRAQIAERTMGTHRVVLRGVVQTPRLAPAQIEWVFEVEQGCIQRLAIHHLRR